jgi:hypothetical protein
MCGTLHAFTWSSYNIRAYPWRENLWRHFLLFSGVGVVYLFISWNVGMVKSLIRPYLLGFVLLEVTRLLFWGLILHLAHSSMELVALGFAHIWIGCMHIVAHFLFLEVGYEAFY